MALNQSTINGGEIRLSRQSDGALLFPAFNGQTNGLATYELVPPVGGWLEDQDGIYNIELLPNTFADQAGNQNAAAILGTLTIAVAVPDTAPPTASLISASNATSENEIITIVVQYSDTGSGVNVATFGNDDIRLVRQSDSATLNAIYISQNNGAATYQVSPGAGWAFSDNGTYDINLQAGSVADLDGNGVAASTLGAVSIALPAPDTTPPTATLSSANNVTSGTDVVTIVVSYADIGGVVNTSTFGTGNLLVTGPSGFSQQPVFVSNSGTAATYHLDPPNDWTDANDGTYTIAMRANQVQDDSGNSVAAGTLGTFTVLVPAAIDSDASAFLSAASIQESQTYYGRDGATVRTAVNDFVTTLKTLNLWGLFDAIYLWGIKDAAADALNLKDPRDSDAAYRIDWNGTWTHSADGVQGDGSTAWGDTHLIPSAALDYTDIYGAIYIQEDPITAFPGADFGAGWGEGSNDRRFGIVAAWTNDTTSADVGGFNAQGRVLRAATFEGGLYFAAKLGDQLRLGVNSTNAGTETRANAVEAASPIAIGAGATLTSATEFSDRPYSMAAFGLHLTQAQSNDFLDAYEVFQVAIGRTITSDGDGSLSTNPNPQPEQTSTLVFADSFPGPNLNPAWIQESGDNATQLTIVNFDGDTWFEGFTPVDGPYRPEDQAAGNARAEIAYRYDSGIGSTIMWSFELYIDKAGSPDWAEEEMGIMMQLHGRSSLGWGSPLVSLRLGGGAAEDNNPNDIYIQRALNLSTGTVRVDPWQVDRSPYLNSRVWVTCRCKVTTATDGFLEVWVDGTKVVSENNIRTDDSRESLYVKLGPYSSDARRIRYRAFQLHHEAAATEDIFPFAGTPASPDSSVFMTAIAAGIV